MPIYFETQWRGIHAWERFKAKHMITHVHDYVEIIYIAYGELTLYVNFESFTVKAGEAAIIFPGQIHGHEASTGNHKNYTLLFPKTIPVYDGIFEKYLPEDPILHIGDDEEAIALLFNAAVSNRADSPYAKGLVQGYISLFLGRVLPRLTLIPIRSNKITIEKKLLDYCSENFRDPISLDDISEATGYSATYISHLFSEKFKMGFSRFISTMRVDEAKKLLRSKAKITEISLECGFGSIRNFNRVFKDHTGLSPSEYRSKTKLGK